MNVIYQMIYLVEINSQKENGKKYRKKSTMTFFERNEITIGKWNWFLFNWRIDCFLFQTNIERNWKDSFIWKNLKNQWNQFKWFSTLIEFGMKYSQNNNYLWTVNNNEWLIWTLSTLLIRTIIISFLFLSIFDVLDLINHIFSSFFEFDSANGGITMAEILHNDWAEYLNEEFQKEYYIKLRKFLAEEYRTKTVYPDMYDIFNALHYTPYKDVKVVILGQDPYHGPRQAHGLSFSVQPGVAIPPSLVNIYKELQTDLGCYIPNNGYLKSWADQGVLLLNTSLTVITNKANSHAKIGWEIFTDRVIQVLNEREDPVIFILWGGNARSKKKYINTNRHHIIESVHPSPLSAYNGFFGSKPFSRSNVLLEQMGKEPINWQIPNI